MIKASSIFWFAAVLLLVNSAFADAGKPPAPHHHADAVPFRSGETLTYDISWSNLIHAGTAVLMLTKKTNADGDPEYHILSSAHSGKLLSKFYTVSDTIESVMDAVRLRSLSYRMDQRHGNRTKKRQMTFNYGNNTVTVISDGQKMTYPIPDDIQDPLSALYFIRTKDDFVKGKSIPVHVHDDGKNWTVDVQILGREAVTTDLGTFKTIKLKTYPKYEGVFQNTGEIYIWITDDKWKIPVLMKSEISIGSIVSTLVRYQPGVKP